MPGGERINQPPKFSKKSDWKKKFTPRSKAEGVSLVSIPIYQLTDYEFKQLQDRLELIPWEKRIIIERDDRYTVRGILGAELAYKLMGIIPGTEEGINKFLNEIDAIVKAKKIPDKNKRMGKV